MNTGSRIASSLLVGILLSVGCARQPSPSDSPGQKKADTTDKRLPFDQPPEKDGIFPSSSLVPDNRSVPAGTPLTVRLKSSISSATANPGDSFQAVLEEPILVQDKTIVPPGSPVTGEVVALNRTASLHAPAYLRLKLTSLVLQGKTVAIESSSVFAKAGLKRGRRHTKLDTQGGMLPSGSSQPMSAAAGNNVQFGVNRRLTFRLTAPMAFSP